MAAIAPAQRPREDRRGSCVTGIGQDPDNEAGVQGHGEVKAEAPPRLKLVGVSKSFPGVRANDNVHLSVRPGEIHALLGENGAGKSTLVKMIYGVLAPDDGRDPVRRRAGAHLQSARRPPARHRHGVSAFLAVRGDDGAGEHRARARLAPVRARTARRVQPGARNLPPQARCAPDRLDAERRRASAHRDRPRAPAQSEPADHGRADVGADAAGGRATVRDAQAPGLERLLDPLHFPQAARDHRPLRHGDHPARRQGRGELRSEARDFAVDGRNDDRRESEGDRQAALAASSVRRNSKSRI